MTSRWSRLGAGPARPLLRYAAVWIGAGLAVALAVVLLSGAGDGDGDPRGGDAVLPAVRQTDLERAASTAGCRISRGQLRGANPPVGGRAGTPARPGTFEKPPPVRSLVGALRRGIVVIHYRGDVDEDVLAELETIRDGVPAGTILTRNGTGMRFQVAATAYGRLLGCARYTAATPDALRLFRGRYLGQGPDG